MEVDLTSRAVYVDDGDTFTIETGDEIRLADINTPEEGYEGYSKAKNVLSLVLDDRTVFLDIDDNEKYSFKINEKQDKFSLKFPGYEQSVDVDITDNRPHRVRINSRFGILSFYIDDEKIVEQSPNDYTGGFLSFESDYADIFDLDIKKGGVQQRRISIMNDDEYEGFKVGMFIGSTLSFFAGVCFVALL